MTDRLTIALAQMGQSVGDLPGNADRMLAWRAKTTSDLIVFPEMELVGYPAEDLVLKPAVARRSGEQIARLVEASNDGGPAMLVGTIERIADKVYNVILLIEGGRIAGRTVKHELPNYGTFDEKRVFASGPLPEPIEFKGVRLGVPICEDIWFPKVCAHLKQRGAELLIAPHGSPYEIDKDDLRVCGVAAKRVAETGLPLALVNRVGGQDELVFDGAGFVLNADQSVAHQLPDWEEHLRETVWERGDDGWRCVPGEIAALDPHPADTYHAMMIGLRDYVNANRFPGVVLGMSGGIDSALSAAVAVDALGPERVWCVMLPSKYTADISESDAAEAARLLGCRIDTIPIEPAMTAFDAMLAPVFEGRQSDLTEENIQARIRGVALMGISNKFGHMLLTTGNKSEMSVGYATLYGDMAGGYSVLKDAYKTTVFALSRWRNANRPRFSFGPEGPVMPERIITRPPSAELRADQKDEDSLPPYDVLDPILQALVEEELSAVEIVERGFDRDTVIRIEKLLYIAEYKRRQSPPGVKLGKRNFGRDRRYPITNAFRSIL
jgi:NAD+ synthase